MDFHYMASSGWIDNLDTLAGDLNDAEEAAASNQPPEEVVIPLAQPVRRYRITRVSAVGGELDPRTLMAPRRPLSR